MFFPEAAKFLNAPLLHPDAHSTVTGASLDTRTLHSGNLFVAIRGAREDGHKYLTTAYEKGAAGSLVDKKFVDSCCGSLLPVWKNMIPVENTSSAFLQLSARYRSQFTLKSVVGVVGSVGKTSTKEFLAYLLRKKYKTHSTHGNLNNHLGLPLTLFGLNEGHEFFVCELGTDRLGEVKQLAEVLKPDFGLLTRIAPEHLETFESMDQVYSGELELFECLRPGSFAVIPDDDYELNQRIKRFSLKWVRVGYTQNADYIVTEVSVRDARVHFKLNGTAFSFPGMATFLARNAAMAIAMAELCGYSMNAIPSCWDDFQLPNGRFQPQALSCGARAIFDGYNASPASFEAALEAFKSIPGEGKKILVVSDMLELGALEKKYHEDLGGLIASSPIDEVIAYGVRSQWTIEALVKKNPGMLVKYVSDAREAADYLTGRLQKRDWVLFKASRSMRVEQVMERLAGPASTSAH